MRHTETASAHQRADRQYGEHLRRHRSPGTRDEDGRGGATEFAREAYRLWQDLPAQENVLFYPLADFNLETLHRANSLADVFVFADWRWPCPSDGLDRKSTRLNSSHLGISYAVFCLKKKKKKEHEPGRAHTTDTHTEEKARSHPV